MHRVGLQLTPTTYLVFPPTPYHENSEQQYVNCSNITMKSYPILLCGRESILADGIKGSINKQDGLQMSELQQYFTWNVGRLNAMPFVSITFENKVVPHSVDLYFHFSPNDFNINIPKIKIYWSSKSPLTSENALPFQRMAYLIANGMYKYRVILQLNDTAAPFTYLLIKMEPTGPYTNNWIFLSEIKVFAKKIEGKGVNK